MSQSPLRLIYKGDFSATTNWLKKHRRLKFLKNLDKYGEMGVRALSAATPVGEGKTKGTTAASWGYKIERPTPESVKIVWTNSNVRKGKKKSYNVAILIQYGHGTGTGGYVQGIDYINPAMKPVFEEIAKAAWEEVTKD